MKILLAIILIFLNGCGVSEVDENEGSAEMAKGVDVRFITPWNGEDGMTLFARIDGTDHLIQDELKSFIMIQPRNYAERGIPKNAVQAATFLETVDSKLDYQGVYVIRGEKGPKIYRGFYVPGLGSEVEWEEVPLRFD